MSIYSSRTQIYDASSSQCPQQQPVVFIHSLHNCMISAATQGSIQIDFDNDHIPSFFFRSIRLGGMMRNILSYASIVWAVIFLQVQAILDSIIKTLFLVTYLSHSHYRYAFRLQYHYIFIVYLVIVSFRDSFYTITMYYLSPSYKISSCIIHTGKETDTS